MNEKQMVEMQKHIEALRKEKEILANLWAISELQKDKKAKQFRIAIGSFVIVITFLGVWIYSLYYANGLLATDNQTKENWKRSAVHLLKINEDLRMENMYIKDGMEEAIKTGFIQKMPPPMVKNDK